MVEKSGKIIADTLSIVAGTRACNARCDFCVSRMTPELCTLSEDVNWRNFDIANKIARDANVSTVLLTGKGEPTLYPHMITTYIRELSRWGYSQIELQSNGLALAHDFETYDKYMRQWYMDGLTTIALSVVHFEEARNRTIYTKDRPHYDLGELVGRLSAMGFTVRITCMMLKGYIDTIDMVKEFIAFCKHHGAHQSTLRPIERPEESVSPEVAAFVDKHRLEQEQLDLIAEWFEAEANQLLVLPYGAIVYDYDGQNICLSNCLTTDHDPTHIRQLIFTPDGRLRYDWKYEGSVIL